MTTETQSPTRQRHMAMYTVHVGRREEEWPATAMTATPRGEAKRMARDILGTPVAASLGFTRAEVRLDWRLLDCFTRKAHSVQSVYSAKQRQGE